MKKLYSVVKNEFFRYFVSPLAYVYLIAFLVLNASFAVYFGHFVERGIADLSPMFSFVPWIFLLFIPGIAMRLWAEEFRNKTVVQIVTMPVSINVLVWGKFFASWLFVALALLLTFPFWITVNYLGNPDNFVIFFSYCGALMLAGCMLAISQTMSALTKNQVVALVLSLVVNFLFFLSGVEYVLGFLRMIAAPVIVDMIASFSFLTHYGQIVNGLLETKSLVFMFSVTVLFNMITVIIVSFKTSGTSRLLKSTQSSYYAAICMLLFIIFCGINLLSNHFLQLQQYDLTEEKLYTISPASRDILKNIPEKITAKFYYSPILGQRNSSLRFMYDRVRLMLQRFHKIAPDKFSYKIYNPEYLSEDEDMAIAEGLQPIPLVDLSQNGFMGIVFVDASEKKQVIPMLQVERLAFTEYDLIENIYQLIHKKKTLGLITSLPILESEQDFGYVTQKWNVIAEIEKFYNVLPILNPEDLSKIDVLMMVHPTNLSTELVDGIKHYSEHGGKSLVLLDVAAEAQRIFSSRNIEFYPSDIGGLDDFWGFKLLENMIVADLENSITVDATKDYSTNPIFTQDVVQFVLPQGSFNPNIDLTKNLHGILFASVSVLVPEGDKNEFVPLLVGADNSGLMPSKVVYDNISPELLLHNFKPANATKVLAALIKSKNASEVIVVADTDFIYDTFWSKSQTIFENNYILPIYDNANFVLNALDYLTGDNSLLSLRGKRQKDRIFMDMEKQRKKNMLNFHKKEYELFEQINQAKKDLNEITWKKSFEERENFSSDELALIAKTRQNLQKLMLELRNIRTSMNDELQKFTLEIKLLNIISVPLIIILLLGLKKLLRAKKVYTLRFVINKEFCVVLSVAALFTVFGLLSIYWSKNAETDLFQNKKVFADLSDRLAQADKVVLRSGNKELEFLYTDGKWLLKGHPCLAVYQERVQRFLSVLAEMTYYEKKSDRLENLSAFGLKPLSNDKNEGIQVQVANKDEILADFYLGKYDIDIGRGGKAAYLRFGDKFQVWMVRADFVDVSLNADDWSYSNLWNLRFGRLKGFNKTNNLNRTMVLVKEMLNTKFKEQTQTMPEYKRTASLLLYPEGGDDVKISFMENNDKVFAHYDFPQTINDKNINFFAQTAAKCYYEIEFNQWGKIKDVLISVR